MAIENWLISTQIYIMPVGVQCNSAPCSKIFHGWKKLLDMAWYEKKVMNMSEGGGGVMSH